MPRKHAVLTVLLLSAAPAAAAPAPRTPPADSQVSHELLRLRDDLFQAGREHAQKDLPKFRPLCDKDGYPLVGNVVSKRAGYQPSAFCASVRANEKKRS